jgi:hypothetical protein
VVRLHLRVKEILVVIRLDNAQAQAVAVLIQQVKIVLATLLQATVAVAHLRASTGLPLTAQVVVVAVLTTTELLELPRVAVVLAAPMQRVLLEPLTQVAVAVAVAALTQVVHLQ